MNPLKYEKDPSFWQKPFRLIQPNLRKIDARGMDVCAMLDDMIELGANAILVNGGGIVAWYPTEHPYQAVNEFMEGDYLGEVLPAAYERGIRALVRMDISKSHPHMLKDHPDWFRRDENNQVVFSWEMPATCPTSPYWEEYNFQVVGELLDKYPIDGFFYNSFHFGKCYCDRCRRIFKQSTGFELPLAEDWNDPAWRTFVEYRYARQADYARRLAEFIEKRSPGTILTIDSHITAESNDLIRECGWHTTRFAENMGCIISEAFNLTGRPFPKWLYWPGEEVKIGSHIKQTCIMLSHFRTYYCRRASQQSEQIGYDLMQIAANGGSQAITFSGTMEQDDRQALPMIKKILNYLGDREEEYASMKPLADVAIIYSQRTAVFYGKNEVNANWQSHYRGMYEILAESHIPFTVLHEGSITLEKLRLYPCVILPNIAALSDGEAETIDQYVAEGGYLISTFETGLFDEEGMRRPEQALKCIGREVKEKLANAFTYLTISDKSLLEKYPETDLLMFVGDFLATVPRGTGSVPRAEDLYGIPAILNTTPEFAYWEQEGDQPALMIRSYGKGSAAYLPWSPDKLYHLQGIPEYKALIAGLAEKACGSLTATCTAPAAVELLIAKRDRGGFLVHLLNAVGTQGKPLSETIILSAIEVKVKGVLSSARSLVHGQTYSVRCDGEHSFFTVPSLGLYDAIVVN